MAPGLWCQNTADTTLGAILTYLMYCDILDYLEFSTLLKMGPVVSLFTDCCNKS